MTLTGTRVGHFLIRDLLGRGGMGEVYVGFDETLERKVALKAIRAENRFDPASRARFVREARVLSRMDHPNICRIYDYVEGEHNDFLVLELIDGRDLHQMLADGLEPATRLRIAEQIAGVLVAAHAAGVVHRDLKPANVMLTPDGEVKVLDFGLARTGTIEAGDAPEPAGGDDSRDEVLAEAPTIAPEAGHTVTSHGSGAGEVMTRVGDVMGSPLYMSPEQARGEPASTPSDLYSFGLLLQTLFTNTLPYPAGMSQADLLRRARNGETNPVAGLSSDLTALINRLKSLAPSRRPTAVEAAERLRWIREKPRRRMRRIAVGLAVVAIAIAGLKYTVDLRHERAEADRRRAQAEDLISFMLGDLRERLEPVGRLDVLDAVGDKALDYFASLSDAEMNDDELFRRSKALYQIGEVRMSQGSLDAAEEAFRESLTLAELLAERDPERVEWQVGLGAAHFWVGNLLFSQDRLDEALGPFRAYLDISQRLAADHPDDPALQMELAYAHTNIGGVELARGKTQAALTSIRKSVGIIARVVESDPTNVEWRTGLANIRSWLASTLESEGLLEQAREQFAGELAVRRELVEEEPANAESQLLLANAHHHLANVLHSLGRVGQAWDHYQRDLAIQRRLVALDPTNTEWKRGLAVTQSAIGSLLHERAELDAALESFDAAMTELLALIEQDSGNTEWVLELARLHAARGNTLLTGGRAADALDEALRTAALLSPLSESDPESTEHLRTVCQGLLLAGRALTELRRNTDAREAWQEARRTIEPLARESSDPALLALWAQALISLGRHDDAKPVLDRLADAGYRRADLLALCRRHGLDCGANDRTTSQEEATT